MPKPGIRNESPEEKNNVISISEWHEMALQGTELPLRIPIHGNSMFPLIRKDTDYVTIKPMKSMPEAGDIVLFADLPRERYVLHRVWKTDGSQLMTWGDNSNAPDGWISQDTVWGKVILIERGRIKIRPNAKKGCFFAKLWHPLRKAYYRSVAIARDIYHRVRRRIRKIRKE